LKVTKCSNIPIDHLLSLAGVIEGDEWFNNIREYWDDGSGNDGPDNQGGPAPVGEWQFTVYCTGSPELSAFQLAYHACRNIPDPRDFSYEMGEACLDYIHRNPMMREELVNEDWPVMYSELMNNPIVKANNQPRIVNPHPSLFVHIRGGEDLTGIEIVKMEWDHNIARSEEELRRVGRESRTITQKCEAKALVTTLQQLALET
jgi:hypothetical protein